jgi:hypothetical protein
MVGETLRTTSLNLVSGDANLDGKIGFTDFQILLDHWQNSGNGIGWTQGDFNGDGVVNFMDFQAMVNNWDPTDVNYTPAPEPVSVVVMITGSILLLRRRLRHQQ